MSKDISTNENTMLSVLETLAIDAGAIIMEIRSQGVVARNKVDQSPVTQADEAAEKIILQGLALHFPTIPVVAEEAAAAGDLPVELGRQFFLVDPLDGTKEFIAGREDFTVNIALIEDGVPVCGVVYAPAHGAIYSGDSQGASKSTVFEGSISALVPLTPVEKNPTTRVVASRSHLTPDTEAFIASIGECQLVNVGSSLKFCLLAEGKADIYPRFGRTMEWDTAAGDAVLRAVGGTTNTLDGTPLVYGKRNQATDADFANPHFVSSV